MRRINLTDDDMAANRQQQLSDKQRQMVQSQRLAWIAGTIGFAGVVLGLTAVLLFKLQNPIFASRGELFIIVPLTLFWLWLLRHVPQRWRQTNRDLSMGQVALTEGEVQTDIDFGIGLFRPVYHAIHVNGRSFRIPKTQQRLFKTGQTYRIYHTPHAHQFLATLLLVTAVTPTAPPPDLAEPLTLREQEVLQLIATGLPNKQIGSHLSLSVNTVKMYTLQLYKKLGVNRRTEAVALSLRQQGLPLVAVTGVITEPQPNLPVPTCEQNGRSLPAFQVSF